MVRASATARILATVRPPHGEQFTAVSAAGDDRTFVLAAETPAATSYRIKHESRERGLAAADAPERFYLLHLNQNGRPDTPVPLSIPVSPTVLVSVMPFPVTTPSAACLGILTGRSGRLRPLPGGPAVPAVSAFPGPSAAW